MTSTTDALARCVAIVTGAAPITALAADQESRP